MSNISYTEGYADKSVLKEIYDLKRTKQDALTAGDGITIVDNVISSTGGGGGVSKEYVDEQVATRQPIGDYATRTELAIGLGEKQDAGDYATSADLADGLAGKQDVLTAGANITITNNVISATGELASTEWGEISGTLTDQTDLANALAGKQTVGDYATNTRVNQVEAEIPDVSGLATKAEVDAVEAEIPDVSGLATNARVDAVEAEIPDVSGLATKTELTNGLAGKQNVLTAGTNISIVNDVISATGGGGGDSVMEIFIYDDRPSSSTYQSVLRPDGTTMTSTAFLSYVGQHADTNAPDRVINLYVVDSNGYNSVYNVTCKGGRYLAFKTALGYAETSIVVEYIEIWDAAPVGGLGFSLLTNGTFPRVESTIPVSIPTTTTTVSIPKTLTGGYISHVYLMDMTSQVTISATEWTMGNPIVATFPRNVGGDSHAYYAYLEMVQ